MKDVDFIADRMFRRVTADEIRKWQVSPPPPFDQARADALVEPFVIAACRLIHKVPAGATLARCSIGYMVAAPGRPAYIVRFDGTVEEINSAAIDTMTSLMAE